MTASTPMLITFVVYIAAMVLIGLIAYLRTKNLSDYILGGRSISSQPLMSEAPAERAVTQLPIRRPPRM